MSDDIQTVDLSDYDTLMRAYVQLNETASRLARELIAERERADKLDAACRAGIRAVSAAGAAQGEAEARMDAALAALKPLAELGADLEPHEKWVTVDCDLLRKAALAVIDAVLKGDNNG